MKSKRLMIICCMTFAILLIITCVKAIAAGTLKHEKPIECKSVEILQKNITGQNSIFVPIEPVAAANYNSTIDDIAILEDDNYKQDTKENKYTEDDIYLWAKIVMCEAEGESQLCKEYIAQVIKNRVDSNEFPDTIYDVIFQKNQFTPTFNGRWERVEPNQDCYDAVYTVINSDAQLIDALYFECCDGDSWHSRNLTKIAEEDGTRFYK